jgi:hypothetical protein
MAQILAAGHANSIPEAYCYAVAHATGEDPGMVHARVTLAAFEKNPPRDYESLKPLMADLLQNNEQTGVNDLQTAYHVARAISPYKQQSNIDRKRRASNASLTGAPYGNPTRKSEAPRGSFGEAVDDVRSAIDQLR